MRSFAGQLREELMGRNRIYARGFPHVESYGSDPVIVYSPDEQQHGNFFTPAYLAICANPDWSRRLTKVHTRYRSLPKSRFDTARRWRELDSSMSSDALLMNIFATPGVSEDAPLRAMMGVCGQPLLEFGWKARIPLSRGLADRTEVDLRWGELLLEAKLTEAGFQCRECAIVEAYRDFDEVFDRELLPRMLLRTTRRRHATEFAEEFTQEWEEAPHFEAEKVRREFHSEIEAGFRAEEPRQAVYAAYQLIRNVLAAYSIGASFSLIHDQRRPDLREAWFKVICAVRSAEMRGRCKVLTWQELVPFLPAGLQAFLDLKYGIVAPHCLPTPVDSADQLQG